MRYDNPPWTGHAWVFRQHWVKLLLALLWPLVGLVILWFILFAVGRLNGPSVFAANLVCVLWAGALALGWWENRFLIYPSGWFMHVHVYNRLGIGSRGGEEFLIARAVIRPHTPWWHAFLDCGDVRFVVGPDTYHYSCIGRYSEFLRRLEAVGPTGPIFII